LLTAISDRFVAMESGRVIAEGTPAEVQADARVVDSFLGGSVEAIARSGATPKRLPAESGSGRRT
jgi:branched-chain amino acid transport system ATP-binding protein